MRYYRFQNKICESAATLPMGIVVGALLWFLIPGSDGIGSLTFDVSPYSLAAMAVYIITAYIILETNNQNALVRIRTRIVSAIWALLIGIMPSVHHFSAGMCAALGLAASHYLLFLSYQKFQPVGEVFHAFSLFGIACIALPQLVVLTPLYYWYLIVYMRCITWRVFWAGIVGLIVPVWLLGGYCILTGSWQFALDRLGVLMTAFRPEVQDWQYLLSWRNSDVLMLAFLTLTGMAAIVHFMQSRYDDKIRTRMLLYIYMMQSIGVWVIAMLNPLVYEDFIPALIVCISPLMGHHFALTDRVVTNIYFCLCLVAVMIIALVNYGISY